jgi:hypothetical protein
MSHMTGPTQPQAPPRISPTELFGDQPAAGQRMHVGGLLPSLLVNAGAPFVAYQVLTGNGMGAAEALTVSAVFPVIGIVWGFARTRSPDMIGIVSLVFIVVGVATSLISGDPRFILIKESLLTGVFGLVCLVSLLLPRPLMFYFGRQFAGGGDPARAAAFEAMWRYPRFRAVNRNMTVVWGVGYLAEAAVRVVLSFAVPIPVFLLVSPVLALGVTIALISWTLAYARRSARRGAERLATMPTTS